MGLEVIADGRDVLPDSEHLSTHHTIYPSVVMTFEGFVAALSRPALGVRGKEEGGVTAPESGHDIEVWRNLAETHSAFLAASREFFSEGVDRVTLVREALRDGKDKFTVCHVLTQLQASELERLLDVLVEWASTGHSLIHVFREAILSLPREWVLANIEEAAEPFLRDGTCDEFRRFLELYIRLDHDLTLRLARRASAHPDADIHEAGTDFQTTLVVRTALEAAARDAGSHRVPVDPVPGPPPIMPTRRRGAAG